MDSHKFGKRSPVDKPRLELVVTNLMVSGHTLGARPAAANKGQGHPVTGFPAGDIFADSFNDTRNFMSGYVG